MRYRAPIIGVVIGMLAALIATSARSLRTAPDVRPGPMMSETGGTIDELVIQYVSGDAIATPVYRDLLPQLPAGITIYVLCPTRAAFDELRGRVGETACRLVPVVTDGPMTIWSRDRWIALEPREASMPVTLLSPDNEAGAEIWPERAGDAMAATRLSRGLLDGVVARRLPLYFDGGDFLADDDAVFVTPAVLRGNLHRTIGSRQALIDLLTHHLGKRIVLLDDAPDHHAGMFMMAAGDRTMVVGDPSLAQAFVNEAHADIPSGADTSAATQQQFDAVARQMQAEGYRVVRIPTVVWPDGKTYLTYVNVLMDRRDGRRIVYMPVFRGAAPLNAAATAVWQGLGYEVRPVDCTSSYRHFGNLHCLVNVLRRSPPTAAVHSQG